MLPKSTIDKTECLQTLVGIRTQCTADVSYPFWIEDIEGIDVKKLSNMTKPSNNNGKDLANQLINKAARQMLGDIETLLNDGYTMQNIVGDMCSSCSLLPAYTANTGIIVKSAVATRFNILRITRLTILTDVTGDRVMKIDDGIDPKFYNVTLIAGTLMPVELNYSTREKLAKVTFTDPTVGLGLVSCATGSSCGCGGSKTSNNPIIITGLNAGIETINQYGFIPCASVQCSYDALVCNLVKQTPNIFGLALLYKVGELYYDEKKASGRNNEAVSFNEDEKEEQKKNYARLYWAKIKGTSGVNGINTIVSKYLRTIRADKCVVCEAKTTTAYVTG